MEYKLSTLYPNRKPFMDENGKRKVPDLRTQVLTGEAKRHCYAAGGNGEGQAIGGLQQPILQNQDSRQQNSRQPTDFSGFFKELKQQQPSGQQLQEQPWQQRRLQDEPMVDDSTRFAKQEQPPQQQQAGLSLDQLLSQHSLQAVPPPQQQLLSMINLNRTFAPDASRDGFMRGTGAAGSEVHGSHAAAGTAQERWHLRNMQLVPWDWSVKTKVRLSSAAPFAVLEEQRTAGLAPVCQAVSTTGLCKDTARLSEQERLARALVQYQYPSSPMSGAMMAALRVGPDKEGPASLAARANCWREALRSAYTALRHGHCPVVYVVGQAFRQQFTAVLCAPGVLGCRQLHAVVGRTNRQLRQHFASFGCIGQVAELLEQQSQHGQHQARPQQTAAVSDGRPGSQLLVLGALQVHCLYAALQGLPWCGAEQPDVPLLSAPVQFMHATLSPLRLEVLPDAVHDQQHHKQHDGPAAVQHLHWAELFNTSGMAVLPWTVSRLLELMRDTQGLAGFELYLETEPSSSTINVLPGVWQQARKSACAGGGADCEVDSSSQQQQAWQSQGQAFDGREQQVWATSRALLQGRVLRQIRVCADGELVARLA